MRRSGCVPEYEADRSTNSVAGLAMVLLVVVLALVVVRKLQVRSMMAACDMSQQLGCEGAVGHLRISKILDRLWTR